jgi:hypothetical protein
MLYKLKNRLIYRKIEKYQKNGIFANIVLSYDILALIECKQRILVRVERQSFLRFSQFFRSLNTFFVVKKLLGTDLISK